MSAATNKKSDKAEGPRGLKRICLECGGRFYDLNKRPIICPACNAEFTGEIKVKTRRARNTVSDDETEGQVNKKTAKEASADEDEDEDDETEIVSLDDLESGDDSSDEDDDLKGDLDLDEDEDDLDDLDVDDDLGDLDELEPDADLSEDEDDDGKDKD